MTKLSLHTTIKLLEEETSQGTTFGYVADMVVYYDDDECNAEKFCCTTRNRDDRNQSCCLTRE